MYFFAQQLLDLLGVTRDVFEVFWQKIHSPCVQCIQRYAGTFMRERGEHQHRGRTALHDMAHGSDAIHHRHLVIHGDHVRLERQRLINRFLAIGGGADHLNGRVSRQNFRDAAAEKTGIIHHQDLDYHKHSVRRCGASLPPLTRIKYAVMRNA